MTKFSSQQCTRILPHTSRRSATMSFTGIAVHISILSALISTVSGWCMVTWYFQLTSLTLRKKRVKKSKWMEGQHHKGGKMSNQTQPRQNFHEESEAGINKQINLELYASYVYQSMSSYFDRDDVALPGFSKYFKNSSDEERVHAEKLMKYQNKRGGRIVLQSIQKPERDEWGTGLEAMTAALALEKSVNQALLDLHKIAEDHGDAQMGDFIEGEFLEHMVDEIKELSDHVTQLKRVGSGLGEYHFDRNLNDSD